MKNEPMDDVSEITPQQIEEFLTATRELTASVLENMDGEATDAELGRVAGNFASINLWLHKLLSHPDLPVATVPLVVAAFDYFEAIIVCGRSWQDLLDLAERRRLDAAQYN